MIGLLGNSKGKVKPWWLPFDWVFCRIVNEKKVTKVIIVKNDKVHNIYDLPVEINKGAVYRLSRPYH